MTVNVPGNLLVMFKVQGCTGCGAFEPIFHRLANEDSRVSCGVLDITYNRDVVQMSRTTTTAIQRVPHLIMYMDGMPRARFKGKKDLSSLKSFISEVFSTVPSHQPQGFVSSQANPQGGNHPRQQGGYAPPQTPMLKRDYAPPQQGYAPPQQGYAQPQQGGYAQPHQGGYAQPQGMPPPTAHPSMANQCEKGDDGECITIPEKIIPHNMPWESDFKRLTGVI